MTRSTAADAGFSIVEIIIAMFLLAMIAVALMPALLQGIQYSSRQSAVATATREINSIIEQARNTPTCPTLSAAVAPQTVTDGAGRPISISGAAIICPSASKTVTLRLTALDNSNNQLATATAIIYVP